MAAVFSDRYSHFGYEPHLGGNKFYDVEGFPAITRRKSTIQGKYGYAKLRIVDLPTEIVIFSLDGDGTGEGEVYYIPILPVGCDITT